MMQRRIRRKFFALRFARARRMARVIFWHLKQKKRTIVLGDTRVPYWTTPPVNCVEKKMHYLIRKIGVARMLLRSFRLGAINFFVIPNLFRDLRGLIERCRNLRKCGASKFGMTTSRAFLSFKANAKNLWLDLREIGEGCRNLRKCGASKFGMTTSRAFLSFRVKRGISVLQKFGQGSFAKLKMTTKKTLAFLKTQKEYKKLRRRYRTAKLITKHLVFPELLRHKPLKAMLALLLIITILTEILQPQPDARYAQGATYTFVQNSWAGGVSSTATAAHSTDQSNWNKYASSTNITATTSMALSPAGVVFGARNDVTTSTDNYSIDTVKPSIVVNTSTGVAYMVYASKEYNATYYNIALRTSTNAGVTWGARVNVTANAASSSRNPVITLDSSGNLYVVYSSLEYNGSNTNIALRTSTNGGVTWGARVNITANSASSSLNPAVVLDSSNNLYVAYYSREVNATYYNIALRTSTNGGATWGARVNITANSASTSLNPVIAIDSSSNIYVAYYSKEVNATYDNIALRTSTNGGTTWGARNDLTASTTVASQNPVIAIDSSSNIYVAYNSKEKSATYNNIALRTSTNAGVTWGARVDITALSNIEAYSPSIVINSSNNLFVAYYSAELTFANYNIALRTSTNAGATWGTRNDITTSTDSSASQQYPVITLDASGNRYIGYYSKEYNVNNANIAFRASSISNFGARKDVTVGWAHDNINPKIAVDNNGVIYEVYQSKEYNSSVYNIALRTSTNGGATWGPKVDVTANTTVSSFNPVIAINSSNNLFVAYYSREYDASYDNIALRTSTNGGVTWGARKNVTAYNAHSNNPSIAIDSSNNLYVLYRSKENDNFNYQITLRTSTNGGVTIGASIGITPNGNSRDSNNPAIALDSSNNLYVAYYSKEVNATYDNIALRTSTNGGVTWGARNDITASAASSSLNPTIDTDSSNNLYVAYNSKEYNSSYDNIALRTSTNGGVTWGARVDVSSNTTVSSTNPALIIDSLNNLYVAYSSKEYNSSYDNIALRTSTNAGATWGAKNDLTSNTTLYSRNPAVAISPGINSLFVTWDSKELDISAASSVNNIAAKIAVIAYYSSSGNLISSPYNTDDSHNVMAELTWDENASLPANTSATVSLRAASTSALLSSASWSDFTASTTNCVKAGITVTCGVTAIPASFKDGSNDQWWQYKAAFTGGANTPQITRVFVKYVVNASPEVQNASSTQNSDGAVTINYQVRDSDTDSGTTNSGFVSTTFQYCANATTTGCVSITSFPAGTGINVAVNTSTWSTYTATWTPRGDNISTVDSNAVIKVIANDNEAANSTASTTTLPFALDSLAPSGGSIVVNASSSPSSPALLTLNASDSSTIQMKISTSSALTGADWQTYATTSSISLTTFPATVYVQFRDAFNNTTTVYSATTPEYPTGVMIQDISNVKDGLTEYRMFVAWKVIANPTPGFGSYKLYRTTSTDQTNWSLVSTIGTRTTNFYSDSDVAASSTYYYKILSVDFSSNTSRFSATVNGVPNGVQDGSEGGGATASAAQPTISNVATSSVSQNSITIKWDTDVLSNSKIGYSTASGTFTTEVTVPTMLDTAASLGQHSVVLSGLTPSTTYYFKVYSTNVDNVGASSTPDAGGYSFSTLNGTTISNISNPVIYNTRAKIVWDTNQNATEYVTYSTSSNFTSSVVTGTIGPYNSHSIWLTDLSPSTRYYYYVQSKYNGVTSTDNNVISGVVEYYSFLTTYDTTGPTISSISSSISATSTQITWTTSELADTQIVYGLTTAYGSTTTLDSTLTAQHAVTLSGLSTSTLYHYKIRATDANGNLTQSSDQTFTTLSAPDTAVPTISGVATSSVSLTSAVVSWSTNENSNSTVDYGTASGTYSSIAGDVSDYTSSTHSVTLSNLSGNTVYYFRVRSQDSSGNTATSSQYTFLTTADITAPTITGVAAALAAETSAVINWTTNESANSEVYYGTATSSLSSSVSSSTLATGHSVTVTGLTKLTTYYFYVKSADGSANTTTDNNSGSYYSFTTADHPGDTITIITAGGGGGGGGAAIDRDAPMITNLKIATVTPYSAVITWATNESSNSVIKYGASTTYENLAGDVLKYVNDHRVELKNLDIATTYHLKVLSSDNFGNYGESADQVIATLNIDGTPVATSTAETKPGEENSGEKYVISNVKRASDKFLSSILEAFSLNPNLFQISDDIFIRAISEMTNKVIEPPVIVGIKPTVEVKGTSAIIRWSTDKKSTSEAAYAKASEYKPDSGSPYANISVNPDEFSTSHSVELSNLEPGTTYHFQVQSKGIIGSEAKSGDFTFTTQSELPTISDIRIKTVKDSEVTVGWKTNIPTAANLEYTSQRTNQTLTQGDNALLLGHTMDLKNLEGGTNYTLVIKAKDEFGNEISSAPLKFSTSKDFNPPRISKLSSESTLYPGQESKVQTIISWETDEPATSQVFYQEGFSQDSPVVSLPYDPALNTRHIVVITKFKPGAVYRFSVESKDISENLAKSETFSVLTPQQKETILDIIIKNFESIFGWTKQIGI